MKRILIIVLAMMMLLSCVACSNNNNTTDPTDGTKPSVNDPTNPTKPGQTDNTSPTKPIYSSFDIKPPVDVNPNVPYTNNAFAANDPRKLYLEEKYGVKAYLVEEKTDGRLYALVSLEGYDGTIRLFAKTDLVNNGAPADRIATDYVDDGYFIVSYAEMYAYFAKAVQDAGVTVDRLIVEYKGPDYFMFDPTQDFATSLASAPNAAKRFNITVYDDFVNNTMSVGKILDALKALDFTGSVQFQQVLQDISNVSNTDLKNDFAGNYSEFFERQSIK